MPNPQAISAQTIRSGVDQVFRSANSGASPPARANMARPSMKLAQEMMMVPMIISAGNTLMNILTNCASSGLESSLDAAGSPDSTRVSAPKEDSGACTIGRPGGRLGGLPGFGLLGRQQHRFVNPQGRTDLPLEYGACIRPR